VEFEHTVTVAGVSTEVLETNVRHRAEHDDTPESVMLFAIWRLEMSIVVEALRVRDKSSEKLADPRNIGIAKEVNAALLETYTPGGYETDPRVVSAGSAIDASKLLCW
jgi:hypothetical protein